ncbi:MAG: magnesium-translocating P-type ATPase [Candidatus ainarchaeum sp.]|nr:magnesium-translocating P-type ATPase [Candidatus ainarchaeum sp.]
MLFSIALAVGLTPELLPMIISINLSKGAVAMSKKGAIVKRLASIENFGAMDVLCADKTGTLTENKVSLFRHIDFEGRDREKIFEYGYLNSHFETGLKSHLDEAILNKKPFDTKPYQKIDEIPFDFIRKKVSVVVETNAKRIIITKGAPEEIFKSCSKYELNGKISGINSRIMKKIQEEYRQLSSEGFMVLGLAYKQTEEIKHVYEPKDESEMTFLGFLAFIDPPKKTAKEALELLKHAGISLKLLTGDNELVAKKVCEELGFEIKGIVLGSRIADMTDPALARVVENANIFARVTPIQKNRIIQALKSNGHIVGFMGDGINDAPSMRMADVSISVENAVDIAKESADIILLKKDLHVLKEGVLEGRKTFGNTMKYIMMGLSSNFGNMFSAAGGALFLPFLPMTPIQILLNNLLYDTAQVTIPTDNVDDEYIAKPKRMDVNFIKRFMIFFGPISSLFDFLTFFAMLFLFNTWTAASAPLFQTAWFIESFCTQALIIFVIRTRKSFYKSRPSKYLIGSTICAIAFAVIMPFTPLGALFGFVAPPLILLALIAAYVITYLGMVEAMKHWFYKKYAAS